MGILNYLKRKDMKFGHRNSPPIVDCEYYWGDWSDCSVSCGNGTRTIEIKVIKDPETVEQKYRGIACPDVGFQTNDCSKVPCPVDCEVEWTPNSPCNVTCGGGWRERFTVIQQPEHNGSTCPDNRIVPCNEDPCPCLIKEGYTLECILNTISEDTRESEGNII